MLGEKRHRTAVGGTFTQVCKYDKNISENLRTDARLQDIDAGRLQFLGSMNQTPVLDARQRLADGKIEEPEIFLGEVFFRWRK